MQNNKVIVMVSDLDDAVHGEINVLDGPDLATRFVETLLESGFERERIRVFVGDEMMMEVHHRPVVSLLGNSRTGKEEPQEEEAPDEAPSTKRKRQAPPLRRAPALQLSRRSRQRSPSHS